MKRIRRFFKRRARRAPALDRLRGAYVRQSSRLVPRRLKQDF